VAKSPKPAPGGSRRDRLASFEAARKAEQRRRTLGLFAICGVLALALLAYPLYLFVDDYRARNATITDFGPAAAAAGCDPVASNPATGSQEHVPEGTEVTYDRTPPDSGQHYDTPAPFTRHFYTTADRPEVETLVHNLEHGYTVAWYRSEAPQGQIDTLSDIAKTFGSDDFDLAQKFIAAPWSEADGGAFPDGKNLVLTRWTANPANPSDAAQHQGVRQACDQVSGAAIADFMEQYPAASSPEPNGA
jgi:hypothetical protein